jgi:hypothetical protein
VLGLVGQARAAVPYPGDPDVGIGRVLEGPVAVPLQVMAAQIRWTERKEIPACLAMAKPVRWIAAPGRSAQDDRIAQRRLTGLAAGIAP